MTQRVVWRGVTIDARTRDMLAEVARLTPDDLVVTPTQGSWTTDTAASANTHAGGGAVDLRTRNLTSQQRTLLLNAMRKVGFAAWLRKTSQGFSADHLHAVAVQPGGKNDRGVLSQAAHNQVVDYLQGRNGLANDGPDDGPRNWAGVTWERYRTGGATPAFPGTVRHGSQGEPVRVWQVEMIHHGFLTDNAANRDGVFGPGMDRAARETQRALDVPVDGILGSVTWVALSHHYR